VSDTNSAILLNDARVELSGAEILRGLSCRVPVGCLVGLVGPNGAGKSTLLRAAGGQVPLSAGSVEVAGSPLHRMSRKQIARQVCLLPQDTNLAFAFTVREVVAMGRNPHLGRFQSFGDHDRDIVRHAMCCASVEELAARRVTELSGGERQRVLLARSLATEAPILLLDEPMASLDILHQLEVVALLQRLTQQGKTVVTALHDLNTARRVCSHVLLLHHGRLVAQGSPAETLSREHVEHVFGVHVTTDDVSNLNFELPRA
jgi:iron complex transport system ATP-binding protein